MWWVCSKSSANPENRITADVQMNGIPESRICGSPNFPIFRSLASWKSVDPEFWVSGYSEILKLVFANSETLKVGIPRFGIPGIQMCAIIDSRIHIIRPIRQALSIVDKFILRHL